ncbi:hypothetical protein L226DRAFT_470223, partial [Lentinus tigrinus ALCF2SS1-7]|uniref:uncharacterized protein n=1 Tax=Lentinus tigrinus ALCF2SS1-7 TaxID=1328758 RepID=UPI00116631B7
MPPPGFSELSPGRRAAICELHRAGWSYRHIADKTGVSTSTAWYTVQRERNFHTHESLPRSGRPSTLTDRKKRQVIRDLRNHRTSTFKAIADS